MKSRNHILATVGTAYLLIFTSALSTAADPIGARDSLDEFTSKEGKFSVRLPGKPEYSKTTVGEAKELHHMFSVGTTQGVYLISYQENPNLKDATDKGLMTALESGRDRLLDSFKGKLLESKETQLERKYPGLDFRLTVPAAKGEARCRYYMVGTRLYQVMALGTPQFAADEQATEVLDSFKLLP